MSGKSPLRSPHPSAALVLAATRVSIIAALGCGDPRMAPKYDFWKAISRQFILSKTNHENGK